MCLLDNVLWCDTCAVRVCIYNVVRCVYEHVCDVCRRATSLFIPLRIDSMCGSLHHGSLALVKETECVQACGQQKLHRRNMVIHRSKGACVMSAEIQLAIKRVDPAGIERHSIRVCGSTISVVYRHTTICCWHIEHMHKYAEHVGSLRMTRTYGCVGLVLGRWSLSSASDHMHVVVALPTLLSAELSTQHVGLQCIWAMWWSFMHSAWSIIAGSTVSALYK